MSWQCNYASRGWLEARLRQRVQDIYVAKGVAWTGAGCTTTPTDKTLLFEPEGDIAFVAGPARIRMLYEACSMETGTCARATVPERVNLVSSES